MSTHTLGQWFLDEETLTIRSKVWEASDQMADYRGCIIADLKPALGACDDDTDLSIVRPHARSETNANACLIVAAPELLIVLAGCADALKECALMLRHLKCPGHATVADIHQEAARAAIRKAKGE